MSAVELLNAGDVDRIFDACEQVGAMSYRYGLADALAAAVAVKMGASGRLTVRLSEREVDSVFAPLQGASREIFRSSVARGVEGLVRPRIESARGVTGPLSAW